MVSLVCMCETEGDSDVESLAVAVAIGINDVGDANGGGDDVRDVDVDLVTVRTSGGEAASELAMLRVTYIACGTATLTVDLMLAVVNTTVTE